VNKTITIAHGNGGAENHELISKIFYRHFQNEILQKSEDAALRLTRTDHNAPFAVQIAGRETSLMVEAALIAKDAGADIIHRDNLACL